MTAHDRVAADPAPTAGRWPLLSAVMPVRDEATSLLASVEAVLDQDYPGEMELVMAVGPSGDATEQLAASLARRDPRVRVVDNPSGLTPAALNAAIAASRGSVVARVDGHAELPQGYLRRAVELLRQTGADNVGGIQKAAGDTAFERAVAAAMTSRFGVGDAKFHYGGAAGPTDTVYLGCFRREALERVGGFDEALARSQDSELNYRIRATGGVVYFHPDLAVRYRPRSDLAGLARQYFHSGRWKRAVLRRHPRSTRWRQLVPPAAVVGCGGGLVLGATVWPAALAAPGVYAAAVLAASAVTARGLERSAAVWLPAVFAVMHGAWGLGFLVSPRSLAAGR